MRGVAGRRRPRRHIVAMIAAGLGIGSPIAPACAQSSIPEAGEVAVISLREALERAVQYNPEYRQALNRMELEGPQRRQAWGAFLPSLNVSYGTSQSFRQESTAVDFFGNPIDNPEVRTVVSSYSSQGATLGLDLFQGGERFHVFNQARAEARVDRLGAERDLNRILAEVQRQFLFAQRQKARLAVEEELLAARERDFEVAERRFELATIGRSDLLGATLDLQAQRVTVTDARGEMEKGMFALRRAIGDPALRTFDVEQPFPDPIDPATLDLERLVARGLAGSPTVGVAEVTRVARQSALSAARSTRWPSISLTSSFDRGSYGPDQTALFDFDPGDFGGRIGLNVTIPLFSRFQTSQQIAAAEVELRNSGEQLRQAEIELEEQVRSRYVDLETAWANVVQRETALEVARERLRIVQEEYRLAVKSIEELRAAVRDEAAAQRDLVDQGFEFAVALLGLYEAAGVVAEQAGLAPESPLPREQD